MELFASLMGNDKIKKTLANDIYNENYSHAYIIEGAKGSGKHTAAYLAAAAVFCRNKNAGCFPCGQCTACKKTFEKINADITVISREGKATLGIDAIRKIKESLYLAPVEMKHKVYIIEDADKMTKSAQNALLLSLEEPPDNVLFLLLCENSLAILETIKSRAPVLRCESFTKEFIKSCLSSDREFSKLAKEEPEKFDEACSAACGSIGMAKSFLTPKEAKEIHTVRERAALVAKSLCCGTSEEKMTSLSLYPASRNELCDFLKLIRLALRDILYIKKSGDGELLFFTDAGKARDIANGTNIGRLCDLDCALQSALCDIYANSSIVCALTLLVTK